MKNVFNWLGLIANSFYVTCIIVAKLLGDKMQASGNIQIRNISYAIATIMTIAAFALIPAIWHITLGVLLPIRSEKAILVDKYINKSNVVLEWNLVSFEHLYLVFELEKGSRQVFELNNRDSHLFLQLLPYDTGTLFYKKQGKHLYFDSFTPDNK